jgi:hypothetical protein
VSHRMRHLLIPQWPQPATKSMMRYVKMRLRFLCNGRFVTLSTSPISVMMAPTVIKFATRVLIARLEFLCNGRRTLPRAHLRCILIGDAPDHAPWMTL